MALTPWIPEVFAIIRKKFSSPAFLSCPSIFARFSFMIIFSLVMAWLLISALSLRYFSFSCNILWNSVGELSLTSYIACEIILAVLSNLPWASSFMESCFSVYYRSFKIFLCGGCYKGRK